MEEDMAANRALLVSRTLIGLFLLAALVLQPPAAASAATIVYVRYNAHGANNGTSWTDAYKSLATALKKAPAGSQIWVAKGSYYPTARTDPLDPRSATFTLRNKIAIYGGFKGTETLLKQRKPLINVTTLTGFLPTSQDPGDDAYHVVTGGATNSSAVLDGFEIRRGFANGPGTGQQYGGGIYNGSNSPTLRNLRFLYNFATLRGGAIYNENASPAMLNLYFYNNSV